MARQVKVQETQKEFFLQYYYHWIVYFQNLSSNIYKSVLETHLIEVMAILAKIYTCCLWEKTEVMISSIEIVVCQANFMSVQND